MKIDPELYEDRSHRQDDEDADHCWRCSCSGDEDDDCCRSFPCLQDLKMKLMTDWFEAWSLLYGGHCIKSRPLMELVWIATWQRLDKLGDRSSLLLSEMTMKTNIAWSTLSENIKSKTELYSKESAIGDKHAITTAVENCPVGPQVAKQQYIYGGNLQYA